MKKLLLSFMMFFATIAVFSQGSMAANPDPIVPNQDAVFTFTVAGSTIDITKDLFVHTWLEGTGLSQSYGTGWDSATDKVKAAMKNNGDGTFSITINIKTFFNVSDADMPKVEKIGVIARDGVKQTKDFMFGVGAPIVAADRFKFDYGVEGGSWSSAAFENANGDGNTFSATIIVPEDFSTTNGWVGYNGGGIENPDWVAGRSYIVEMKTIPGIKAGEVTLYVFLNSTEPNWGLTANLGSGIGSTDKSSSACFGKVNSIEANFEGNATIEVFTLTGQKVYKTTANNNVTVENLAAGVYVVKVDSKLHKVLVK